MLILEGLHLADEVGTVEPHSSFGIEGDPVVFGVVECVDVVVLLLGERQVVLLFDIDASLIDINDEIFFAVDDLAAAVCKFHFDSSSCLVLLLSCCGEELNLPTSPSFGGSLSQHFLPAISLLVPVCK